MYKTIDILTDIAETNKVSEKQINLIKRRLNAGETICLDYIWNNTPELTKEQNNKGITYLRSLWKTPGGKERKNNPFGYREQSILNNFTGFELAGFYNAGRGGFDNWIPLYNCCGGGGAFQYYMNGGQINIVG